MCSFPVWCLGEDTEFDCIGPWMLPFHLFHNNVKTTFYCLEYSVRISVLEYEDDVSKWILQDQSNQRVLTNEITLNESYSIRLIEQSL